VRYLMQIRRGNTRNSNPSCCLNCELLLDNPQIKSYTFL
jgi:hypothetical protein